MVKDSGEKDEKRRRISAAIYWNRRGKWRVNEEMEITRN